MNQGTYHDLLSRSFSVKKRFLRMYKSANAGHVGCSLSVAEILTYIRFNWMNENDEMILSKGHAAAALYSLLAEDGRISELAIDTFYKNGTLLAAHPPINKIKGIPFATGSLGHGLSLAAGMAFAQKLKRSEKKIFCITSDGEMNEGSTWEAALFIGHHQLSNLIWFIDRNNIQGYGFTEHVMRLEPLAKKAEAFGFGTIVIDGHDLNNFELAKDQVNQSKKPTVIICNTIKGRHWKLYENKLECHYLPMDDKQFDSILKELEDDYKDKLALVNEK